MKKEQKIENLLIALDSIRTVESQSLGEKEKIQELDDAANFIIDLITKLEK